MESSGPLEEPGVRNLKAHAKALPPLGRALDMRGSHPAEEIPRTGSEPLGVTTPRDRAFGGRKLRIARWSVDRQQRSGSLQYGREGSVPLGEN